MGSGLSDNILKQSFQFALSRNHSWWMNGHQHLRAAAVLLEKCWAAMDKEEEALEGVSEVLPGSEEYEIVQNSFLYKQATLLVAFGIENMLKALWAEQRTKQIKASESLPRPIREHDLNELADLTDLQTTPRESDALTVLSEHAIWAGRYPIPREMDEYVDSHGEIDRRWIVQKHPGPVSFPDELHSLIEKIREEVEQAREDEST